MITARTNLDTLEINKVKLQIPKNEELKNIIQTDFGRASAKTSKRGSVIEQYHVPKDDGIK